MNTQNTIDEIAKLKRALREAPTAIVKTKIKEKIETLNKVLKDSNATTKELAVMLVGAKSKINSLDAKEWKQTMKRLSTRSEYSFLKGMTKNQIKDDLKREAKPVGWRFKGRGNYRKPTKSEIIAGRKKGTVYSEKRPERSDVTHPAKLEKGGGVDNVKKIIDGDNVWYLTYIDSTHFFLSNSPDFKGNAYHIGQFRGRPFYDEVNQWLKSFNKSYAKGGGVSDVPNTVAEFKAKMNSFTKRMNTAEGLWNLDNGKAYNDIISERDAYYQKTKDAWYSTLNEEEKRGNKARYNIIRKMINEAFGFEKGGKTDFGMLSVKAGIDNNPNPTYADKIAGAKMNKMAEGGGVGKYEKEKLANLAYQLQNADDSWIAKNHSKFVEMQNEYKRQFKKVYGHSNYQDPNEFYANGGGVGRTVMIPTFMVKEIRDSVKMGYDNLVEGMIGRKRKGVMLINENYEVRGTYDIGLKDAIEDLINKIKSGNYKIDAVDINMSKGGGVGEIMVGDKVKIKSGYSQHDDKNAEVVRVMPDNKTLELKIKHKLGNEYVKFEKSEVEKYAKGGGVDGFNLVYQKWSKMMGGNGVSGTIRTTPEMYYVATIDEKGNISFEDLESNTKSINKEEVKRLWDTKMIPDITPNRYGDVRDIYKKGGMMNVNEENREMVENNNIQIMHHVKELKEAISKAEHIPAWVVAKVYDATRSLSDITHYLDGTTKMEEGGNLIGNQHKLDMNKNGRLDAEDFKILRRKK